MKILKTLLIISLCTLFIGCNKEKPKPGQYAGFFHYDTPQVFEEYSQIELSESKSDYIIVNGSTLKKNGKKISGMIDVLDFGSFVNIEGEWSHKLFSKNYTIKGTFTQIKYQGGNQYQYSGTFEIKSN